MPALTDYASEGVLTINSVVLNTPAWTVVGTETGERSLFQVWGMMADRRGENRIIPGAAGVIPYPRRRTETRIDLRAIIIGDVNSSGVEYGDDRIGLQTNLAVWETLIETSATGTGAVTASLTRFTGAAITGQVQVLGLVPSLISYSPDGYGGSFFEGALQLNLLSGRLA